MEHPIRDLLARNGVRPDTPNDDLELDRLVAALRAEPDILQARGNYDYSSLEYVVCNKYTPKVLQAILAAAPDVAALNP